MTDIVMSEHTTKITSRAIAIPFQFLCGGLLLPSSSIYNKIIRELLSRNLAGQRRWDDILKVLFDIICQKNIF